MITAFHHIGCLVENIDIAVADYKILCPELIVSDVYDIEDQLVKVAFVNIGNTHIEFVEPYTTNTTLVKLLSKKPGYYHIGIFTDNIDDEIARLEENGYRFINKFRSMAFNNRFCAFLYNQEYHLIELIEKE